MIPNKVARFFMAHSV